MDIAAKDGIVSEFGSVYFNGGTTTVDSRVENGSPVTAYVGINFNEEKGIGIIEPEGAEVDTFADGDTEYNGICDSDGNRNIRVVIGTINSAITVEVVCDQYWGTVTGGGSHEEGASVTLTATPADGTKFQYWLDTSVQLGNEPTEAELRAAIVSYDASYTFTATKDVRLEAVFSLSDGIGVTPMLIAGTDKKSLLEAERMDVDYDFGTINLGTEPITLPGEMIDEIITIGDKQYRFAGFIFYGYDEATETETAELKKTLTIGKMPLYNSAEYWDWFTSISDGLFAAYMPYTPDDTQKPDNTQKPDDTQKPDNPQKPTDPETTDAPKKTNSPKTGDNSHMALWFALLLLSGGAVITLTVCDRKRRTVNSK